MQINTKNLLYDFFTPFNVTTGKMSTLTLSYSSEGSLALSVFRHHELKTVLSYIYLDFLTTSFLFLVVTLALKQNPRPHMPFLTLGLSCPLQTILLSDLVECDSPLQIVMAIWQTC
jgi:hypothetical protein